MNRSKDLVDPGAPEAAPAPSLFTPAQERQLKYAVIGMGVILLLGFALVIGRILYLVNTDPKAAAAGSAREQGRPIAAPAELPLPRGAVIRHLAVSGGVLAVHYETPSGGAIRLIDLANGGRISSIPIVEERAPPR